MLPSLPISSLIVKLSSAALVEATGEETMELKVDSKGSAV